MASMPTYHLSKGPFGYLDQLFGQPHSSFPPGTSPFDAALGALLNPNSAATLQAAANAQPKVASGDASHFTSHWLGGWWKELAPADTLRAGIREAIAHARSADRPMEFFWVCTADREFQVYYCQGPHQVTVMILTPPPEPPGHTKDPLTEPEDIWVVKLRDAWDLAYPNLGPPGLIPPPQVVAGVTTGPPPPPGSDVIRQRIHHTARAEPQAGKAS